MNAIIFSALFLSTSALAYEVNCTGYDSQTDAYVTGTCSNGSFSGYDARTGAMLSGTCTAGGSFSGFDTQTDAMVNGSCMPAPPDPGI